MTSENTTYSGYLLKRSNKPYSPSPLDNQRSLTLDNESYDAYQIPTHSCFTAYPGEKAFILNESSSMSSNPILISDAQTQYTTTEVSSENPVQSALDLIFAASFFSSTSRNTSPPLPPSPIRSALLESHEIAHVTPINNTIFPSSQPISSPIMIGEPINRVASANVHRSIPTIQPLPDDFIDPKDGHIWRAKWCVLENGILYFYKNSAMGNSSEATVERRRKRSLGFSTSHTSGYDVHSSHLREMDALGKSPMPRSLLLRRLNEDEIKNSLNNIDNVFWEKRVRLDMVGTVRAAEVDYGERSFELLALRSDIPGLPSDTSENLSLDDRLILRAASVNEMNEWMIRFHESCSVIMKQLVRSLKDEHSIDINLRRRDNITSTTFWSSSLKPHANGATDFITVQSSVNSSLSHGHGRSDLHRRRNKNDKDSFHSVELSSSSHNDGYSFSNTDIARSKKYIPPHLRQKTDRSSTSSTLSNINNENNSSVEEEEAKKILSKKNNASALALSLSAVNESDDYRKMISISPHCKSRTNDVIKLGGCADPEIIDGSILDKIYIPRESSKAVRKTLSQHYDRRYSDTCENLVLWEIGAVSDCGIRDSNEDAYLIVNDLRNVSIPDTDARSIDGIGVFCIFDGHCGNHTARFASERLPYILLDEAATIQHIVSKKEKLQQLLTICISRLDFEFRELCSSDGRQWDSGSTAIITLVLENTMAIATLGDSNGVFCYSLHHNIERDTNVSILQSDVFDESTFSSMLVLWKEVASVHSPGREDEKQRIESANGWITTEQEIPIASLLHRIDFLDQDVLEILQRCFSERFIGGPNGRRGHAEPGRILHISRLCGELAVSRALGDYDFKAPLLHTTPSSQLHDSTLTWANPSLLLPYPENHSQIFVGDLVSAKPDIALFDVGIYADEFLILACDGLWDVMDSDDAVRIAKDLLYERGWSAKSVAVRLAELAIHLGSSDNVTVLVLVFRPP